MMLALSVFFSEHVNSLLPNRTAPYSCQGRSSISDCKEEPDHYYKKVSDGRQGGLRFPGRKEMLSLFGRGMDRGGWLIVDRSTACFLCLSLEAV